MKILFYSASPECQSGYGNVTRNMVKWLHEQGHAVACATKHPVDVRHRDWLPWEDDDSSIPIVSGTNVPMLNRAIMDGWKMDVCISFFDTWILTIPVLRHIPWVPIDTETASEKIINAIKDCPMQIAVSRHGEEELRRCDLHPKFAPIGFDPEIFHPKPTEAREFRENLPFPDAIDADDMFLIGSVGVNYKDDRKGFILLLLAFKKFHKEHSNARLYLHTQARKREGIDYHSLALNLGLGDLITWADQDKFWYQLYSEEDIATVYSGLDVFCLPTRGEGFGMPVLEAQACGTPVVVTDNTSGPELCQSGFLIETDSDDYVYTGLGTWRKSPKVSAIVTALEKAYRWYCIPPSTAICETIPEGVEEYKWQNVWDNYWTPILQEIESMLPLKKKES